MLNIKSRVVLVGLSIVLFTGLSAASCYQTVKQIQYQCSCNGHAGLAWLPFGQFVQNGYTYAFPGTFCGYGSEGQECYVPGNTSCTSASLPLKSASAKASRRNKQVSDLVPFCNGSPARRSSAMGILDESKLSR
jgi:hypothetical protein